MDQVLKNEYLLTSAVDAALVALGSHEGGSQPVRTCFREPAFWISWGLYAGPQPIDIFFGGGKMIATCCFT